MKPSALARHGVPIGVALAVLLSTAAALGALGARQRGPGVAWLASVEPAPALQAALADPGTRLVAAWAGGRLALLRAETLAAVPTPRRAWVLRTPLPGLRLAGCG